MHYLLALCNIASLETPLPIPKGEPKGLITPPVAPRVENGLDIAIDAAFTWWKTELSGLTLGQTAHHTVTPAAHFTPGFQLGLGMDLWIDGFDAYADYTWMSMPGSRTDDDTISSSRFLQYNILDLELGRHFYLSKKLSIRPLFGFKLARMFDKLFFEEEHFSQTLSGFGTRGGIQSFWRFWRIYGFYGNIAITALWSSIHNTLSSVYRASTQTILPIMECQVGLFCQTPLSQDRYFLYAQAGWEEQIWLNYNHMNIHGLLDTTGTLTIQGLICRLGLVF